MSGADVAHRILRAGTFSRSQLWRELYAAQGYDYTAADVRRLAHRLKAWRSLRGRLSRAQRERGKERIIERLTERVRELPNVTVRQFFDVVELMPLGWSPFDPAQESAWDWDSWLRQNGLDLSADVVQQLFRVLGELVDEFLAQLQQTGKFEIPAPTLTFVSPGELPAGAEVAEVGRTVSVEVTPAAGATETRVSRSQRGPVVIERVAVWMDASADVEVQVMAVPAGVSFPVAAVLTDVLGAPMFEHTDDAGIQSPVLPMLSFGTLLELWPRKVFTGGAVAFAFSARNNSAALRTVIVSLDGRDVLSPA